jgi:hypothetical protein
VACRIDGIAIWTIVAKNYMPTAVLIVRIPCGACGLVGRALHECGGVGGIQEKESEKCAGPSVVIPVFISGSMIL